MYNYGAIISTTINDEFNKSMENDRDIGTISFTPASFWKRVCSNAFDYIGPLVIAICGIINPYFAFLDKEIVAFMLCIGFLLALFILFVSMKKLGNTWGRVWFGIRITELDGNIPGLWKLTLREFLKLISLGTPLILGFFWIIWDKRKQSWYDKVTKTYVISDPIKETSQDINQPTEGPIEYKEKSDIVKPRPYDPPAVLSTHQETPEIATKYMGFWIRNCAVLVDCILLIIFTFIFYLLLLLSGFFFPSESTWRLMVTSEQSPFLLLIIWPSLWILYYCLLTGITGQTIGKKLFRIKVINEQNKKPGLIQAIIRETFGKLLSTIGFCLGFVWIAIDPKKQGWHDKIVGTYVAKS